MPAQYNAEQLKRYRELTNAPFEQARDTVMGI